VANRIHILGASGSGTTTLAAALSKKLGYTHFDSDDYFWYPTSPKFTTPRPKEERVALLKADLIKSETWILSGANCGWGESLIELYDLVIFLYLPHETRMDRLRQRELQRYGPERIAPGGDWHEEYNTFMTWAASYDTAGPEVRSLELHNQWLKKLNCPILRIEGENTLEERMSIALEAITQPPPRR